MLTCPFCDTSRQRPKSWLNYDCGQLNLIISWPVASNRITTTTAVLSIYSNYTSFLWNINDSKGINKQIAVSRCTAQFNYLNSRFNQNKLLNTIMQLILFTFNFFRLINGLLEQNSTANTERLAVSTARNKLKGKIFCATEETQRERIYAREEMLTVERIVQEAENAWKMFMPAFWLWNADKATTLLIFYFRQ